MHVDIFIFNFILLLTTPIYSQHIVIVTQFDETQYWKGLLFFRSLWIAEKHTNANFSYDIEVHACVAESDVDTKANVFATISPEFSKIGVHLHHLHNHQLDSNKSSSKEWKNLICASQMADYFFLQGRIELNMYFIDSNFIVVGDLRSTLFDRSLAISSTIIPSTYIFCAPKLLETSLASSSGVCETKSLIVFIPTRIGTEFYSVLNATILLNITVNEAFNYCIRSVSDGIIFFKNARNIIRAGRMWYQSPSAEHVLKTVSLIEFDGQNHAITVKDCQLFIHVEWPRVYTTVAIISTLLNRIYESSYTLAGCADDVIVQYLNLSSATLTTTMSATEIELNRDVNVITNNQPSPTSTKSSIITSPRVFDVILFNDEISLLQLRLEYLKDLVDMHIIVEARKTFTGKEKKLFYDSHKHWFYAYHSRIVHVIVEELAHEHVRESRNVWENEYFSRNAAWMGLEAVGATESDVMILCDVDEIPHPRAIATLRALHSLYTPRTTEDSSTDRSDYDYDSASTSKSSKSSSGSSSSNSNDSSMDRESSIDSDPVTVTEDGTKSFDPLRHRSLGRSSSSKAFKLQPMNFMYNFDCFMGDMDVGTGDNSSSGSGIGRGVRVPMSGPMPLVGGAAAAVSIGFAKQLHYGATNGHYTGDTDKGKYITLARLHLQSSSLPYPLENVLTPGSWHLSFFGGVQKIKNKLLSYSHQNFVRQFIANEMNKEQSCREFIKNNPTFSTATDANTDATTSNILSEKVDNTDDRNHSALLLAACLSGQPIIDVRTGGEIIPTQLVASDTQLSDERIAAKISSGEGIDNRDKRRCMSVEFDEDTSKLKELWNDINGILLPTSSSSSSSLESEEDTIKLRLKIAVVSGFIGAESLHNIPKSPVAWIDPNDQQTSSEIDAYFITNSLHVSEIAVKQGWQILLLRDIPLLNSTHNASNAVLNAIQLNPVKVKPQDYLSFLLREKYDFVVWVDTTTSSSSSHHDSSYTSSDGDRDNDNDKELRMNELIMKAIDVIKTTDHEAAMTIVSDHSSTERNHPMMSVTVMNMYHKALLIDSDRLFVNEIDRYLAEEHSAGYHLTTESSLPSRLDTNSVIIYNMQHPKLKTIQNLWMLHIIRIAEVQCEIAFYFVYQRARELIKFINIP